MTDSSILGQVALCHAPFIDRRRNVYATRLTVFPLRPDAAVEAQPLLDAVARTWPADGAQKVSLNVIGEALLIGLLGTRPPPSVMIEVPAQMAADEACRDTLHALREAGCSLMLRGRPAQELPRAVLPCFTQAIIDIGDDRRLLGGAAATAGVRRNIRHVQSGVRDGAALEAAFAGGAEAVVGWPFDDSRPLAAGAAEFAGARPAQRQGGASAMQVVLELIDQIDRGATAERMEQTLRRDPSVAFRLLRYINTPAFGLRAEVASFSHAMAMLGQRRLKRWLVLLLATVGDDADTKPLMHAAVRRGLLMEELARPSGDEDRIGEMFFCGVFSLLDRAFGQPFEELLRRVPVTERVVQALAGRCGHYHGWLQLMRAAESESLADLRNACEALRLDIADVNRALLRALAAAAELG